VSEKIYTLPDLLPAPTSDLQLLVRRLIEYADWSLLPALMDELRDRSRVDDIRQLQTKLTQHLITVWANDRWIEWVEYLWRLFLFDLFDVNGIANRMAETKWLSVEEAQRRQVPPVSIGAFIAPNQAVIMAVGAGGGGSSDQVTPERHLQTLMAQSRPEDGL
jgi:hypothetical protein